MSSRRKFIKQAGIASVGLLASNFGLEALANTNDKKFDALQKAISAHAKLLKIPGFAAAVVKNGRVEFVHTEGFADLEKKIPVRRDHIFPVASVTKTFTAVALMQCEQEGKMSMEDYVLDYPYLSVGYFPEQLQDPNVKIKHVLSHTSEGDPGSNYIYNGGRYNMVYGVFEKISANTKQYEATADEIVKRIIQPLKLKSTLPGYPNDVNHPALSRIVNTYKWDAAEQQFQADRGFPKQTTLYPATGLLTTIDDLAAYSHALDENSILRAESYKKMTSPFIASSGRLNSYGLGWASQRIDGREVHWAYGYGDSYAALLIRIPQDKLTFILLSNAVPASEPFNLGSGCNVMHSVFGQAFFKHIVNGVTDQFNFEELRVKLHDKKDPQFYDEVFSQALVRYYTAQKYNEHNDHSVMLLRYLALSDPARFKKVDTTLIYLIAKLNDPQLKMQMQSAIEAYAASGWLYPDIHALIATWYDRNGDHKTAREWYHLLADSKYAEQREVRNACALLGKYYYDQGEKEKGRKYMWRKALFTRYSNFSHDDAIAQIKLMQEMR